MTEVKRNKCRVCKGQLNIPLFNLDTSPPSNSYLASSLEAQTEESFPLEVKVCERCWLAQLTYDVDPNKIFSSDYAYFSSFSSSWLKHAEEYFKMIQNRLKLDSSSQVIEVASNDGYLLKNFVNASIPCYGIDPSTRTAEAAKKHGVDTIVDFLTPDLAKKLNAQRGQADLIIGNNVLAHQSNILEFVEALKHLLKPEGVITLEFPHLEKLLSGLQFDTVYHEHYTYLSILSLTTLFQKFELEIVDLDELKSHGGSLRIYVMHKNVSKLSKNVTKVLEREKLMGLDTKQFYPPFQNKIDKIKSDFLDFIIKENSLGRKTVAYGAAAKGNTFLNFCRVKETAKLSYVVDASPHKQGKLLPGSHIPILSEEKLIEDKPDNVIILPWNLEKEISKQLSYIRDWGGRFVIAIPELKIY